MTATVGRALLLAYLGQRNGRTMVYVPCDDGVWHEAVPPEDLEPGDLVHVGRCAHLCRVAAVPFDPRWRNRGGYLSMRYAREQVRPSWFEI